MVLEKDGQVISLDNENHVSAFLSSGWAEAKASAPAIKEEAKAVVKAEEKKPVTKKKQEK
jgi:hypothetical protein